jgi:hypothetical protein
MTATRRALFNRHGGVCVYCRRQTEMPSLIHQAHDLTATVEHVVPVSRGGAMRGPNVTLACHLCNGLKGDMTPHQWAEFMISHPQWWIRSKRTTASERRFARRQPLPISESQMILREGKKAWREWKASQKSLDVCPVMTMVMQVLVEQRYGVWKPRVDAAVQPS